MTALLEPEKVPLDERDGALFVTGTRMGLDMIVHDFNVGASAEEIALSYPSVTLADVYLVIAFYLRHKAEVDVYIAQQTEAAAAVRTSREVNEASQIVREQLVARR